MPSPHVFPRHTKVEMPVAVGGDGCYVIDESGKRYLDGCGGAAVSCLGHSDTTVVEAIKAQLDQLPYAHTGFFTTRPAEELAAHLASRAPDGVNRVYFVSGGSEAAEAALKLARQYFWEKGEKSRANVIARWQSYHGNTLGALAAGGNRWRRAQFEPLLTDAMHHIDACHYWRWAEPGESEEDYGRRIADQLEAKILELGPETVAAFIAEPVVGATMGAVPPVAGYFKRIREICDRYGVLLILDEVMCGMGRTGTLFASEQDGVVPDMILIAKGLGAGYQPIGATLVADHVYEVFEGGSGFFQHGHTYGGHPTACAAGRAVLSEIEGRDLLANVREVGAYLKTQLLDRFGRDPHVGDIRGRGLFLGLELVADRETKAPFDAGLKLNAQVKRAAMADGLMVYPMGGTIDGVNGDHVLIAPPFILTKPQADEIVDKLSGALDTALAAVA
ncbi:aspartate aminotransferase family protein [Amorphus sp. 3PC139-8]|uniref:aspartate aminotransferase family protein n=1 Tax=Amorphus sp. 3PC139-8 TaxID=2735676 RepID=UPI00345D4742